MDGNGAWNNQNNQGQQYDQYGRPLQNQWNQQMKNDVNNVVNQQYYTDADKAWGDKASQNIYGRVEQNNLQYNYNTQPYKKSKAGLFVTIGVLGVIVVIIAAIVLLARAIFGSAGVKEVTGEVTLSEVEDYIVSNIMADDFSFEQDGLKVECLGLAHGDLGDGFYLDDYLTFEITNKSGYDIDILTDLYVNDFLIASALYDSNHDYDTDIKDNTKGLYFVNSHIFFAEDVAGLSYDKYDKFVMNWRILDSSNHSLISEKTTSYNKNKNRILEDMYIENGFIEIANYDDLIRVYAKVGKVNDNYLGIDYYGVSELDKEVFIDFPEIGITLNNSDTGTIESYTDLHLNNSQDIYETNYSILDVDIVDSTSKRGDVYKIENNEDIESVTIDIVIETEGEESYEKETLIKSSFEYELD